MPRLDKKKLDEVLATAGVDESVATRIREANDPPVAETPRGHGAPSQVAIGDLGDL